VALHDVRKCHRKFIAFLYAAAGNVFISEKLVVFIDAIDKAQQRRYGVHIASVMVQRVRQHGQLQANLCAIPARMALNVRQDAASVQHNVAVFDVTLNRPDANIPQKAYGLVELVRDGGLYSQDNVIHFGAHVVENYPNVPLVETIILLQRTKYFCPRDVSKLPVYQRVFFGACATIYV